MFRLLTKFVLFNVMFFYVLHAKSTSKALRDPFNLPHKAVAKNDDCRIKLLGITSSGGFNADGSNASKFGAVLTLDGQTETVFVNDKFFGFRVLSIEHDNILLLTGRRKKKLYIE